MKQWLSLEDQINLMKSRGLIIQDEDSCRDVLSRVGYYHLSGYGRFFQIDPHNGLDDYRSGTDFETIAELQDLDGRLRVLCLSALASVELALRTRFAYHFGRLVGPYRKLQQASTWHTSGTRKPVEALILDDLDRSNQQFIKRHRTNGDYDSLPVWVAVECMSFGTLSKAIAHCSNNQLVRSLASDWKITVKGFSSQIRSFVALRNACAHSARLWNDVSKNPPSVPRNVTNQAKTRFGTFGAQSYYQVFVALNSFDGQRPGSADLLSAVEGIIGANDLFRRGLMHPAPY